MLPKIENECFGLWKNNFLISLFTPGHFIMEKDSRIFGGHNFALSLDSDSEWLWTVTFIPVHSAKSSFMN